MAGFARRIELHETEFVVIRPLKSLWKRIAPSMELVSQSLHEDNRNSSVVSHIWSKAPAVPSARGTDFSFGNPFSFGSPMSCMTGWYDE